MPIVHKLIMCSFQWFIITLSINYRFDFKLPNKPLKYITVAKVPGQSSLANYRIYVIVFKLCILG
jgi:hypothetical protein